MSTPAFPYSQVELVEEETHQGHAIPKLSRRLKSGRFWAVVGTLAAVAILACVAPAVTKKLAKPKQSRGLLWNDESMEAWERLNRFLESSGGDASEELPLGLDPAKLEVAQCTIDVAQSAAYLGQVVVWLDKAVTYDGNQCPDNTQRGCAVSVETALTSFLWLASYLSLAASSCAGTLSPKAACAADVTGIAADLGEIATAGTACADDCNFQKEKPTLSDLVEKAKQVKEVVDKGKEVIDVAKKLVPDNFRKNKRLGRRLEEKESPIVDLVKMAKEKAQERAQAGRDRSLDLALCTFDAVQAVSYVIRATKQIMGTAIDGCDDSEVCSINILNIISSFAWVSQFVSFGIGDCARQAYQAAYCSGDISDLVAATDSLVATAMAVTSDCDLAPADKATVEEERQELFTGGRD